MTLIARRSFVTYYDGKRIPIFRGRTRIDSSHELARRFPDSFERVTTRDEVAWRYRDPLAHASDPVELEQMIAAYSQILEATERGTSRPARRAPSLRCVRELVT